MKQRPHKPRGQMTAREMAEMEQARNRMSSIMHDRRRMQQDAARRSRRVERSEHKR